MFYASLSMAIHTPWHGHRRDTGDTIHRFYRTMTFLTRDARPDVPLMREVNEVRYVVHLDPGNRFAPFPVSQQFSDFRSVADIG